MWEDSFELKCEEQPILEDKEEERNGVEEDQEDEELVYVNFLNPGSLLKVPLYIDELKIQALVDSGTVLSFIKKEVIEKARIEWNKDEITEVIVYGGSKVQTLGTAELNMRLDNMKVKGKFHVLDNQVVRYEMILGLEFLKEHGIVIDLSTRTISLHKDNKQVSMSLEDGDTWRNVQYNRVPVYSQEDISVKAKSVTQINFAVAGLDAGEAGFFI